MIENQQDLYQAVSKNVRLRSEILREFVTPDTIRFIIVCSYILGSEKGTELNMMMTLM